jgi:hypothetical protein
MFTVSIAIFTGTPSSHIQIKSKPHDENKRQQYHTSLALFILFHSQEALNDAETQLLEAIQLANMWNVLLTSF